MTDVSNAERHATGERRWRVVVPECGHSMVISTVIGDFDYEGHHRGLPQLCLVCQYQEDRPAGECLRLDWTVVEIPLEDWEENL